MRGAWRLRWLRLCTTLSVSIMAFGSEGFPSAKPACLRCKGRSPHRTRLRKIASQGPKSKMHAPADGDNRGPQPRPVQLRARTLSWFKSHLLPSTCTCKRACAHSCARANTNSCGAIGVATHPHTQARARPHTNTHARTHARRGFVPLPMTVTQI